MSDQPMQQTEDQIRFHMAQQLRQTVDKNKEMESSLSQKSEETKRMMDRIKQLEESLNVYQNKGKEKLKRRYENVIKPFFENVRGGVQDDELRDNISQYQSILSQQIENPKDADAIRRLEPEIDFVATVASASQIQSSKYEEFLKREQDLRKELERRDQMIKQKEEELRKTAELKEQEVKQKDEELQKINEERNSELQKLKEELENTKKELEKTSTTIANTEKHIDESEAEKTAQQEQEPQQPMDTAEPVQQVPYEMRTSTGFSTQPIYPPITQPPTQPVYTVAGSRGVGGGANEMYSLGKPTTSWRSMNMNITKDMYSEDVYRAYKTKLKDY